MSFLRRVRLDSLFVKSGKLDQLEAALTDGDFEQIEELIEELRRTVGESGSAAQRLNLLEGRFRFQFRDYKRAYPLLKASFDAAIEDRDKEAAQVAFGFLFRCLAALSRPEEALEAQSQLVSSLRPKPRAHAEMDITSAQMALQSGLAEQAVRLLEEAVCCLQEIREQQPIDDILIQATSLLGDAFLALNQHGEAIEAWSWALSVTRERFGNDHPQVAAMLASIGSLQVVQDDLGGARRSLEESLTIYRNMQKGNGLEAGLALNNLAFILMMQGELDQAENAAHRAFSIGSQLSEQLQVEAQETKDKIASYQAGLKAAADPKKIDSFNRGNDFQSPLLGTFDQITAHGVPGLGTGMSHYPPQPFPEDVAGGLDSHVEGQGTSPVKGLADSLPPLAWGQGKDPEWN
jgi:tetratricopeptide (TPR) repeat protein